MSEVKHMKKVKIIGADFDPKKMHVYDVKTTGKHPVHLIEGGAVITEDKRDFAQGGDMGWFWLNQKEYDYFLSQRKEMEVDSNEEEEGHPRVKVININTSGNHYLINIFYNDLSNEQKHAYSTAQLNEIVSELHSNKFVHDYSIYLKVDFDTELVKTIDKNKLHFIGHLRGIDQYEVRDLEGYELALVLKCGDKYYLSFAECEEKYNLNIGIRIHNAYDYNKKGLQTDALGEEVFING